MSRRCSAGSATGSGSSTSRTARSNRASRMSHSATGCMPVRAILDAATSCELAVVELDSFDGDMFTALADSLAFLDGLAS